MVNITIDVSNNAGRSKLESLLDQIDKNNRIFTIDFAKVNGEMANKNGLSVNYKKISGNGTHAHSRAAKRQNGMFVFYSIQRTKDQALYEEILEIAPKDISWKTCYISNINFFLRQYFKIIIAF